MARRPPEQIVRGAVALRRVVPGDCGALDAAIAQSLDHLRPWMPWATDDAVVPGARRAWIEDAQRQWDKATGFLYLIWVDADLVGGAGLHRRIGPGALEIGYWVRAGRLRRGYATGAARALTEAALERPDVGRVEIRCDVANVASAAVARRLGYQLVREEPRAIVAPGEVGRQLIWARERSVEDG